MELYGDLDNLSKAVQLLRGQAHLTATSVLKTTEEPGS